MNILIRVTCPNNRAFIEEALSKLDFDLYLVKDDSQMLSALHLATIDAVVIDATDELHIGLTSLEKVRSFTENFVPVLLCCESDELVRVAANTLAYESKSENTGLVVLSEADAPQFTMKVSELLLKSVALT
jgi:DNA-binding response OmpR family regulator